MPLDYSENSSATPMTPRLPLNTRNLSVNTNVAHNRLGDENHPPPFQFAAVFTPDAPHAKRRRVSTLHAVSINPAHSPVPPTPSLSGQHLLPPPQIPTPLRGQKRKETQSEVIPGTLRRHDDRRLPLEQRLHLILEECTRLGLPLAEFMYQVFREPPAAERLKWMETERTCFRSRSAVVSKFLHGYCQRTPADVLDIWYHHSYGAAEKSSDAMFSHSPSYIDIAPVRPAMSSFAFQIVRHELVRQARIGALPSSGLHVHIPTDKKPLPTKSDVALVDWRDLGGHTHETVAALHRRHQPLLWELLSSVANPDTYQRTEDERINRPVDAVVSTSISKLTFSRCQHARLGPLMEGMFNFSHNVPFDKCRYDSRVGNTPSYPTMLRSLYGLSKSAEHLTLDSTRDPGKWWFLVIDNVQNYITRRSLRIGRENFMNIGMAGTIWFPPAGVADPSVFDLDKKQKMRAACNRLEITTEQLLSFLEPEHEAVVYSAHWLLVLGRYVVELSVLQARAHELLRTDARRQKLPDEPTECHPIPSTSGRETELAEFLDSVLDFFKSGGQTAERYLRRIFPVVGDGFTFELLLRLMQQRQLHASSFHNLSILSPALAWWHGFWTNDSRIVDRNLVDYSSRDPSTLGFSASKINRKIPKDQGKYNYHQASETLYFVADMRMLDCWRLRLLVVAQTAGIDTSKHQDVFDVVKALSMAGKLPTTLEFERLAQDLHQLYTTEKAVWNAYTGTETASMPRASRNRVPRATTGSNLSSSSNTSSSSLPTSLPLPEPSATATSSQLLQDLDAVDLTQENLFLGDAGLARCKDFMRDVIRSREMVMSAAEGDVGRVWEQMKTIMFCFAGSSHKKYAQYLLEMIIDMHLESTPELRQAILATGVATLSGLPGSFRCTDLLQEYFQKLLEAIVQYKGKNYGDKFMREGVSRNLAHFQRIKEEMLNGVGLKKRSQRRSKPSTHQEMQLLLHEYRNQDVHCFIPRRRLTPFHPGDDATQFSLGVKALSSGGMLKKWTSRMMLLRDCGAQDLMEAEDVGEEEEDVVEAALREARLYAHQVIDDDLVLRELDPVGDARALASIFDEDQDDIDI